MAIEPAPICDNCERMITETKGVIIQGNVYVAKVDKDGIPGERLAGSAFRDGANDEPCKDVPYVVYCWACLADALNMPKSACEALEKMESD